MTGREMQGTISYQIVNVCKAHFNAANRLLSELGLHAGQEMILCSLWQSDGLSQTELAEELGVQPATVTKMLNRMVRNGLVERRKDSTDQRISRVFLTDKGWELREPVVQVWQKLEEETINQLSLEERVLLRRLLMQVRNNLG